MASLAQGHRAGHRAVLLQGSASGRNNRTYLNLLDFGRRSGVPTPACGPAPERRRQLRWHDARLCETADSLRSLACTSDSSLNPAADVVAWRRQSGLRWRRRRCATCARTSASWCHASRPAIRRHRTASPGAVHQRMQGLAVSITVSAIAGIGSWYSHRLGSPSERAEGGNREAEIKKIDDRPDEAFGLT